MQRQFAYNTHRNSSLIDVENFKKLKQNQEQGLIDPYIWGKLKELNPKDGKRLKDHVALVDDIENISKNSAKWRKEFEAIQVEKVAIQRHLNAGRNYVKNLIGNSAKMQEKWNPKFDMLYKLASDPHAHIVKMARGGNIQGGHFPLLNKTLKQLEELDLPAADVIKVKKYIMNTAINNIYDQALGIRKTVQTSPKYNAAKSYQIETAGPDAATLWTLAKFKGNFLRKLGMSEKHLKQIEELGELGIQLNTGGTGMGKIIDAARDMTFPAILSRIYNLQRGIIGYRWAISEFAIRAFLANNKTLTTRIVNNPETGNLFHQMVLGNKPYNPKWNQHFRSTLFYIISRQYGEEHANMILDDYENRDPKTGKPRVVRDKEGNLIGGLYIIPEDRKHLLEIETPFEFEPLSATDDQMKKLNFPNKKKLLEKEYVGREEKTRTEPWEGKEQVIDIYKKPTHYDTLRTGK